ncbi:MAG: hypothetical protein AUK48_01355 [Oscillatoriales cyanobacterium CG2_30_44_21]|nr:MAG: hypothetical protein AUK48_01355 [Oscillatoriales cyanobacterium CG2_30_44_21]
MNLRQTNHFKDPLNLIKNQIFDGVTNSQHQNSQHQKLFSTHRCIWGCLSLLLTLTGEPMITGDRMAAFAQTAPASPTLMQLNNILNQTVFGNDQITRYAAAVKAIEIKRLEIFKAAKKNPNWNSVASLAESQQIMVCDLSQQPDFLQDLCEQLRSFTEDEIRRYGFTNKDFNQITRQQRQDASLRSLIQSRQLQMKNDK